MAYVVQRRKKWQGRYKNRAGKVVCLPLVADRSAALAAAKLKEITEWRIAEGTLPDDTTAKHGKRPIGEVVGEYITAGKTQGIKRRKWCTKHARQRASRLAWWVEKLDLCFLGDLGKDSILGLAQRIAQQYIQAVGKTGKTASQYRESLMAFCRWLVVRKYLATNPIQDWPEYDKTPAIKRRALTREEIAALLKAAPEHRRLVYETALATGFRAGELRSLRVGDLDAQNGILHLAAASAKNRQDAYQPLSRYLSDKLAARSAGKPETAPLLQTRRHIDRDFTTDRDKAGIPKDAFGGVATFHSLRHTAITLANECGATVKALQGFARHSDPHLTMNIYAHVRRGEQSELAERMGKIIAEAGQVQDSVSRCECAPAVQTRATGTDGIGHNIIAGQRIVNLGGEKVSVSNPAPATIKYKTGSGRQRLQRPRVCRSRFVFTLLDRK